MSNHTFCAIFDMDGVLIDSVVYHWQAINEVLGESGIYVPDEQIHGYIGRTLRSQVEQLGRENGVELDYDVISHKTKAIKQRLLENIQPKEGVVQLLELLRTNDIPMAIATSNSSNETQRRLTDAGIIEYFDKLVTRDDVAEHKPNPAVYLEAARQLDASSKDCVVFEDAPVGIQAGKSAGMACVAVQTPYTNIADLQDADTIVSSLAEVSVGLITTLLTRDSL